MSPNHPKTQHRSIRISDDDWADLDSATRAEGLGRAKVINHLIQWYLRRPGVKQPLRPPRHDARSTDSPS